MIKKETWHKRCLAIVLAGFMLLGASCSSEETEGHESRASASTKAAQPSVGIGRDLEAAAEKGPVEPKDYRICIDPGHGFVDGGTGEGVFEDGVLEKDINIQIANLLVEKLEALGFKTIMTHDGTNLPAGDTDGNQIFSVRERSAYVNRLDIDYLVSIHVNALSEDTTVSGSQIYFEQNSNKVNDWSKGISECIADELIRAFPSAKEPKIWGNEWGSLPDKTLEMTREPKAASSLIEVGFCTNETDRNNMIDPEWQADFAQAVADGINTFFNSLDEE